MKAAILDSEGAVIRVVETTKERAEAKGWVPVDEMAPQTSQRLNELYDEYQAHPHADAAHAKISKVIKTLDHPEDYCTKTAFLGYINNPESAK